MANHGDGRTARYEVKALPPSDEESTRPAMFFNWFERNLSGTKSERLREFDNDQQLSLGEVLGPPDREEPAKERQVAGYTRRVAQGDAAAEDAESVPFFDESCVPVETIELRATELEGLDADELEIIGQKVTHRLAQRPGSYVILK